MKATLIRKTNEIFHFVDGQKIAGAHAGLRGDVTGLWGDVTSLCGDVTGLWGDVTSLCGDVTGLQGDVTGLRGDVTGLRGDVDESDITEVERKAGIDVNSLVVQAGEVAA